MNFVNCLLVAETIRMDEEFIFNGDDGYFNCQTVSLYKILLQLKSNKTDHSGVETFVWLWSIQLFDVRCSEEIVMLYFSNTGTTKYLSSCCFVMHITGFDYSQYRKLYPWLWWHCIRQICCRRASEIKAMCFKLHLFK